MTRALTACAVVALALAGCGGGDGGGGAGGGGKSATVSAGKPIAVSASEYRFDPSTLTVTGGGPITLRVTNDGTQAHDLRVMKDGQSFGGTPVFGPNQTKTTIVRLSPGDYEFVCSVGDHEALGMKGKLSVR